MRFFNHKRRYAGRNFPLLGIPRYRNHDLNLDVEIIGSDEVFNCIQASSNVGYSPDLFGRGTSARRVVSYVASFGNTTLSRIEAAGIGDTLKRDLSSFHEISVRDRNSYEIVLALTGRPPPIHVDPVLAYDFMGDSSGGSSGQRLCDDRYVVAYVYPGRLSREENVALAVFARSIGQRSSSVSAAPNHVATGSSMAIRSSCWRTSVTPRRCSRTRSMERSWPSSTSGRSRPGCYPVPTGRRMGTRRSWASCSRTSVSRIERSRIQATSRPSCHGRSTSNRSGSSSRRSGGAPARFHPCRARERRSSMKTNPRPRRVLAKCAGTTSHRTRTTPGPRRGPTAHRRGRGI